MHWRFIDSDLSEPAYTFAADEAMALSRSQGLEPDTLHFYRRSGPAVSLGYFQKAADSADLELCAREGIAVMRRTTGGSAIYTDSGHLIYGLAVGSETLPSAPGAAMERICSALVLALDNLGVESEFRRPNDILVDGRKISGSAQSRRGGVLLQHGTLVLRNDAGAMQRALRMDMSKLEARGLSAHDCVVSLSELLGREPDIPRVKAALRQGFESALGISLEATAFSVHETDMIHRLIVNKYGTDGWNLRI